MTTFDQEGDENPFDRPIEEEKVIYVDSDENPDPSTSDFDWMMNKQKKVSSKYLKWSKKSQNGRLKIEDSIYYPRNDNVVVTTKITATAQKLMTSLRFWVFDHA